MAEELTPPAVDSDGTFKVVFVPDGGIANVGAPTVTELSAPTVKPITYSLTADGWSPSFSQATSTDDRLTAPTTYNTPGKESGDITVKYVFGDPDNDVADPALTPGTKGFLVWRAAVANDVDFAADQVVDVFPFTAGARNVDAPTANGKWSKTQTLFQRPPGMKKEVAVVAGS